MVKRCCYGTCKSDTRTLKEEDKVVFIPFCKPKTKLDDCLRWIKACGRPHFQLNVDTITKDTYICSKHFPEGKPTLEHPDPIPADGSAVRKGRRPIKRKMQDAGNEMDSLVNHKLSKQDEDSTLPTHGTSDTDPVLDHQESNLNPLEMLATASIISQLREENENFRKEKKNLMTENENFMTENEKLRKENENFRKENENFKNENDDLRRKNSSLKHELAVKALQSITAPPECTTTNKFFSVDTVLRSRLKDLFKYYTGFTHDAFNALFNFLVPDTNDNPIEYTEKSKKKSCCRVKLSDQLFLVLCRLRNGFHVKDLAFRFNITVQVVSVIFNSWIRYMYLQLASLSFWSHQDILIARMTSKYKMDFATTLALIDCTELRTERPSSLIAQSMCYSEYKSSTTLKALVVTDSRGSLMFTSALFTGSISDQEICQKSGFYDFLQDLLDDGYIKEGDGIMADKGFRIEKDLEKLGIQLNIPPFASTAHQMSADNVATTKKIATHRIHVERFINRIKNFKLVGRRIPVSFFTHINEIWTVCCILTTFQDILVQD